MFHVKLIAAACYLERFCDKVSGALILKYNGVGLSSRFSYYRIDVSRLFCSKAFFTGGNHNPGMENAALQLTITPWRCFMKKPLLAMSLIFALVLSGCIQSAQTPTSSELASPTSVQVPTSTPMYLSPITRTEIFVGGKGWATNLNQTRIYNTVNFGEHWLDVTPEGLDSPGQSGTIFVAFPNGSLGWVCQSQIESPGMLYATSDGGRTWSSNVLEFACGNIAFSSYQEGMIVSDLGVGAGSHYVSIYITADGGATWTKTFEHDPSSPDNHGLPASGIKSYLALLGENIALVGGSRPMPGSLYLFRSVNGGSSWNQLSCEGLPNADSSELDPMDIIKIGTQNLIVPVRAYLENGQMGTHFCVSTNAGENFSYLSTLENIEFVDYGSLTSGLAYGNGKMLQTSDGGLTWQDVSSGLPSGLIPIWLNMINADIGFLTTTITPDSLLENRVFMTANNGLSWQPMPGTIFETGSN